MNRRTAFTALFLAASLGLNAQKPMKAPAGGKAISDQLIGIFFEAPSSLVPSSATAGAQAPRGA